MFFYVFLCVILLSLRVIIVELKTFSPCVEAFEKKDFSNAHTKGVFEIKTLCLFFKNDYLKDFSIEYNDPYDFGSFQYFYSCFRTADAVSDLF